MIIALLAGVLVSDVFQHLHLCRNVFQLKDYTTREEAKQDIFKYIEILYDRERRRASLGYLTPVESEQEDKTQQTQTPAWMPTPGVRLS